MGEDMFRTNSYKVATLDGVVWSQINRIPLCNLFDHVLGLEGSGGGEHPPVGQTVADAAVVERGGP